MADVVEIIKLIIHTNHLNKRECLIMIQFASQIFKTNIISRQKTCWIFYCCGFPLLVKMPEGKWPLIPDVSGLTAYVTKSILIDTKTGACQIMYVKHLRIGVHKDHHWSRLRLIHLPFFG